MEIISFQAQSGPGTMYPDLFALIPPPADKTNAQIARPSLNGLSHAGSVGTLEGSVWEGHQDEGIE